MRTKSYGRPDPGRSAITRVVGMFSALNSCRNLSTWLRVAASEGATSRKSEESSPACSEVRATGSVSRTGRSFALTFTTSKGSEAAVAEIRKWPRLCPVDSEFWTMVIRKSVSPSTATGVFGTRISCRGSRFSSRLASTIQPPRLARPSSVRNLPNSSGFQSWGDLSAAISTATEEIRKLP